MSTPELQAQLEKGEAWIQSLLTLMGVEAPVSCQLQEACGHHSSSSGVEDVDHDHDWVGWITIHQEALSPDQIQKLIGDRGEVLDSIQYLMSLILNLHAPKDGHMPFTVDLDGYRDRRFGELQVLAEQAVDQVRATGQEQEILHLSSGERRQIHAFLKQFEDIHTFSRGKEPDRRLVVHLATMVPSQESPSSKPY